MDANSCTQMAYFEIEDVDLASNETNVIDTVFCLEGHVYNVELSELIDDYEPGGVWEDAYNTGFLGANGTFEVSELGLQNFSYCLEGVLPCNTSNCNVLNISVDECMFVESNRDFENKVEIFPSPFNDYLSLSGIEKCNIQVFDNSGRLVFEKTACSHNERLDLGFLSKGIYYISIKDDASVYQTKMVKQ
jgi:hypothetical protein